MANLSQISSIWQPKTHLLEVPIQLHLMQLALFERLHSTQMQGGWCRPTATRQCCVDKNDSETIQAQIWRWRQVKPGLSQIKRAKRRFSVWGGYAQWKRIGDRKMHPLKGERSICASGFEWSDHGKIRKNIAGQWWMRTNRWLGRRRRGRWKDGGCEVAERRWRGETVQGDRKVMSKHESELNFSRLGTMYST